MRDSRPVLWGVMGTVPEAREWPAHFPQGCPGVSESDTQGEFFRYAAGERVEKRDMLSRLELGIGKQDPCLRAGLSCYSSLDHAIEIRKASPRRKEQRIARALLNPECGKQRQTGRDPFHCSVWLRAKYLERATELFTVIA